MSEKIINCAVIGCGFISPAHIDSYLANGRARLVALCDSDAEWVRFAGEKYGVAKTYTDYRELLRDPEIEAVSICLPNYLHTQATIDALDAGKHVLCEKPMAPTAADGRRMIEARDRSGRVLMIGQNQRFTPAAQVMRAMNTRGDFGEIYHIRTGWRRPLGMMPSPEDTRPNGQRVNRNWYNDRSLCGGVLRDLGVHLIDLAMFITDFPRVESASASLYRKLEPDVPEEIKRKYSYTSEDLAVALIKFEGGMSLSLEVSFGSTVSREAIFTNIYGTKSGAERNDEELRLILPDSENAFRVEEADLSRTKPFGHCVDEFLECLTEGTPVPVRPEDCLCVLEVLDLIYAGN